MKRVAQKRSSAAERALQDLIRWAVRFYNNDDLFVEWSLSRRNQIDQQLRRILNRLDVEFDGKTRRAKAMQK